MVKIRKVTTLAYFMMQKSVIFFKDGRFDVSFGEEATSIVCKHELNINIAFF